MRKLLLLIISLALLISGLPGCNRYDIYAPTISHLSEPETSVPAVSTNPTESSTTTDPPPTEETEPADFNIKLSFVGDVMLASYMNRTAKGNFNDFAKNNEPEYFLEKVRHIFEADDFTVANLENVLTDKKLTPKEKDHDPAYWYCSKTDNVKILTTSSVEGVSLANNHINDYGPQGRKDTVATVSDAGLEYGENDRLMIFEKNGFKIAVVCHGLWGSSQTSSVINMLKKAEKASDFQIVFYHGGSSNVHEPEQWRIDASRKLVDAGADLVLGNHPHVLQPRDFYNGVEIMYSLGNFCYGGKARPENRTIIYQLDLTVSYDTLKIVSSNSNIIPCYVYTAEVNNYQPAPIEDEEQISKVLQFIDWGCDSPI
jgi:poly-gamma-glutamate synthesis protein (capsule biosynthesis protein)